MEVFPRIEFVSPAAGEGYVFWESSCVFDIFYGSSPFRDAKVTHICTQFRREFARISSSTAAAAGGHFACNV